MKFHIIIYGCQMNYSDSARIKAVLSNLGRTYVDRKEDADVVILDTCSVRQKSEDKVRGMLKELSQLRDGSAPKVWLTGCMIQHNLNLKKTRTTSSKKYTMGNFVGTVDAHEPVIVGLTDVEQDLGLKTRVRDWVLGKTDQPDDLLYINHAFDPLFKKMQTAFPNVELFFRVNDVGMLPYIVRELGYEGIREADIEIVNEYQTIIPHNANQLFSENTKTVYVPISSGCSQFCAYCIVPYARGLEKNRPVDEIITEVKHHLSQGAQEIVLLGQIVNKHPDFYQILKTVCELPGVRRVRYTSPYPTYYDSDIFALHESVEVLCPHIHMPLQSGSDAVLKKMFRGYTRQQYLEFVDGIRALSRPISITSDIIVGFTDETEDDFVQSMEVAEYAKFDMIYIGIYSPRPGTYGARKYEDNIPLEIKKQRHARLNEVLTKVSATNNLQEVGTVREIVVTEVRDEVILGYSDNMKQVVIEMRGSNFTRPHPNPLLGGEGTSITPSAFTTSMGFEETIQPGQFVQVKIIGSDTFKLFGEVVDG